MSEETVYICDKLEGLNNVKPTTRPCRRAVNDGDGITVELSIVNGLSDQEATVRFCSPAHANFWLSRQRVNR